MVNRSGKTLVKPFSDCDIEWSPSGRYLAIAGDDLRVVCATAARLVLQKKMPGWTEIERWDGDRSLIINTEKNGKTYTKRIVIAEKRGDIKP